MGGVRQPIPANDRIRQMLRIAQDHAGPVAHPEHTPMKIAFQQQWTCDTSLVHGLGFHAVVQSEFSVSGGSFLASMPSYEDTRNRGTYPGPAKPTKGLAFVSQSY